MLAVGIIVLGIISRLIVHIPNFTPIIALALFSGVYLKGKQAIYVPVLLLALTDFILGFHSTMFFTWGSIFLIIGIGYWLKQHKNFKTIFGTSVLSAIIFFIVSNLGVWLVGGIYPLTFDGLADCFVMAVPFFRTTLASTIIYTFVLFGVYEWMAGRVKNTRFANAL